MAAVGKPLDPLIDTADIRAVDRDGTVQTAVRADSFPDGSSGIQEIAVTVT